MKTENPDLISIDDFADVIGVTPRTVRNLVAEGVITKVARGKISLKQAVRALIAKEKASPDRAREGAARAALLEAKQRAAELELAQTERQVIRLDESMAVLEIIVGACRFEMESLAGRCSSDPAIRKTIADEVFKSLNRISAKLRKRGELLARGGGHG